ncbi:MAG: hypothetical protein H6716_05850 [Polyangiaceae bacterium]|nr:hypothetical protein [Polyangiaceae bacterium]
MTPLSTGLVRGVAAILAFALVIPPVAAQPGDTADGTSAEDAAVAEARDRFRAATELERAERWSEAAAELRAALEQKETPGLRFHLAYCEEHQGHYVEALANYRRAKALIDAGAAADDVAELVGPALERVGTQVALFEVVLKTQAERVQVRVDGRAVELGSTVELNPGPHQLEVYAPGYEGLKRRINLSPGTLRLPVSLRREHVEAAAEPPPEPVEPPPQAPVLRVETQGISAKTWALVVESVVLGGAIAAGIGLSLQADRANENADLTRADLRRVGADCQKATGAILKECAALRNFERSADDAELFSTMAFVGAGVTATALIVTALVWPNRQPPKAARTVIPVGPRSSLGLSGAFEF